MKRAEVLMPEALYQKVERLAARFHMTVSELLRKAAEQMAHQEAPFRPPSSDGWRFPEGRHLGEFRAPVEDWRLHANEGTE